MTLSEFTEEVRLMRFAQTQYQKTFDETWRMEKNHRERKVDGLVEEIQANSKITQPNLF